MVESRERFCCIWEDGKTDGLSGNHKAYAVSKAERLPLNVERIRAMKKVQQRYSREISLKCPNVPKRLLLITFSAILLTTGVFQNSLKFP